MSVFVGDSVPYLELVLSFVIVVYVLHTYLDFRQVQCLRERSMPKALDGVIGKDVFQKSRSYSLDKWTFNMLHSFVEFAQTLAILFYGFLPFMWNWTRRFLLFLPARYSQSEIVCTIGYIGLLSALSYLWELPWNLYKTFIIEQKHGFNNQTYLLYAWDTITSVFLGFVFLPPIIGGLTYILIRANSWLPVYLWAFTLAITVFAMTIYPTFIAPLFNKFSTLSEGTLKTKIEELAEKLKFPLKRVYAMDGSKRSAHSNAYMYGLFNNKRIVLFDTLIKDCSEDEVAAVLAHELGHWKMSHNLCNFVSYQIILLVQFVLFSFLRHSEDLHESFGFVEEKPVFISLVLFSFISSPLNELVDFVHNMVSRRFEFQADAFAVKLGMGHALRRALIILEKKNKNALNVDRWYSAYHFSHPPLVERLLALDKKLSKTL